MVTKVEKKISELEQSVVVPERPKLPTEIKNLIEVTDGSVTAFYCGKIIGLAETTTSYGYERISVTATTVELTRLERSVTNEVQRYIHLFPPRLEKKTIQREEMKNLWASKYSWDTPLLIQENSGGRFEYRAELAKKILTEHKIRVTQELMNLVFDPLNKQIEDWYLAVQDWKREKEELMSLK